MGYGKGSKVVVWAGHKRGSRGTKEEMQVERKERRELQREDCHRGWERGDSSGCSKRGNGFRKWGGPEERGVVYLVDIDQFLVDRMVEDHNIEHKLMYHYKENFLQLYNYN